MKKPALGKVDRKSYVGFMSALNLAIRELEAMGDQEIANIKPKSESRWQAYESLNGLGWHFAAAMIRALTADLDPTSEDFPSQLPAVIENLEMLYGETNTRLGLRDESVIRRAANELPGVLPPWVDLDEIIAEGQASYEGKGVYIRDFYHNLLIGIGQIHRALRRFVIENERPELMTFRQERAGGDYVPTAMLSLEEDEERALLKKVIQEANKRIGRLTSYGMRQEPLPSGDFTIIRWLNGPALWRTDNLTSAAVLARSRGAHTVMLDANLALIPFHPVLVEKVIEAFNDLPLYSYSSEAKERGEYPEPTDRNVKFAIRSLVEQANPELDSEEHALLSVEQFELFRQAKAGNRTAQDQVTSFLSSIPVAFPYIRLFEQWMKGR